MSSIPPNLAALLDDAFTTIRKDDFNTAQHLSNVATRICAAAWSRHLHDREHKDNRNEHELIVLQNTMRICRESGSERDSGLPFNLSELRIAVATALLHDLRPMDRTGWSRRSSQSHGRWCDRCPFSPHVGSLFGIGRNRPMCGLHRLS
jgi:hypothetical protein